MIIIIIWVYIFLGLDYLPTIQTTDNSKLKALVSRTSNLGASAESVFYSILYHNIPPADYQSSPTLYPVAVQLVLDFSLLNLEHDS